jgi:GTPase SAR1 family protein
VHNGIINQMNFTPSFKKRPSGASKSAPSLKNGKASLFGKTSKGKLLWNKLKMKKKLLFVTKRGHRNELFKLVVCGSKKTGKTLLCSHIIGCSFISNSVSTDAHDTEQLSLGETLFEGQEQSIIVSDQPINDDGVVTVVHQNHPTLAIGYEFSNGETVGVKTVEATRRSSHSQGVEERIRSKTNTFVTQINVANHVHLQSLEALKFVGEEDHDVNQRVHDVHDEDGNYVGGARLSFGDNNNGNTKPLTMYGIQLLDTPPCELISYNRGQRIINDPPTREAYHKIGELGKVQAKVDLLKRPLSPSNGSMGSSVSSSLNISDDENVGNDDFNDRDENIRMKRNRRKKYRDMQDIPQPGAFSVSDNETNLLWRNCVAGSAVILYNITDPKSFEIARDMLVAIRQDETKHVPVLVIGNFTDLANHADYDFERDCEIAHQYHAFYAYGSMFENRLIHEGKEYAALQLIHRLVLTMRDSGLVQYGEPHRTKVRKEQKRQGENMLNRTSKGLPSSKVQQKQQKRENINALVEKHKRASLKKIADDGSDGTCTNSSSNDSWFGWCGGRA